ncbi:hypothetical protein ACJRO7_029842 [Eucalyptus globulus]|uniref:Uncharacterized protein n=1 Tax=Eucalyptus globulus TaxID=34317 RepID=A0ABD3JD86_EUCGL
MKRVVEKGPRPKPTSEGEVGEEGERRGGSRSGWRSDSTRTPGSPHINTINGLASASRSSSFPHITCLLLLLLLLLPRFFYRRTVDRTPSTAAHRRSAKP